MVITFEAQFCSGGGRSHVKVDRIKWFERSKWENQRGRGVTYTLNLIWFGFELKVYRRKKAHYGVVEFSDA